MWQSQVFLWFPMIITPLSLSTASHQHSAQTAQEENERIFSELLLSIERKYNEVKEMIRVHEKTTVSRGEILLDRIEEEITLLKKKHTDLEKLSHTDDHIHFLQVSFTEYPQHLACLRDLLCHQPFHLLVVELAVSVGPFGLWGPQQHQRGSVLLLWRYQESYCFAENASWRNQQDGDEQNLRSRWGIFSFFVSSRIDVCVQRNFLMNECC